MVPLSGTQTTARRPDGFVPEPADAIENIQSKRREAQDMDFIETREISDNDLDNVSGGVLGSVVGTAVSTADSVAPVSEGTNAVNGVVSGLTGVDTSQVTGLAGL